MTLRSNDARPHIAVFAGPTATVLNTPPLMSAADHGVENRSAAPLRPQRLAAPVTIYIRADSAHPLEGDACQTPVDGYVGRDGDFRQEQVEPDDVPVHRAVLRPEDGLHLLPYVARSSTEPRGPAQQTFYPDAARLFEEIDRFGLDDSGYNEVLARTATYTFLRAAPPGGYTAEGEVSGIDYFPYSPPAVAQSPHLTTLTAVTNEFQQVMDSGRFDGALWLEGSPAIEETLYWLNLLIDTDRPIAGTMAQRAHGTLSADGDRNVADAVGYLASALWADDNGRDSLGAVLVSDELVRTARDVHKVDGRVGGYSAAGETNGVLASIGISRPSHLLMRSAKRHTHTSAVNLRHIPSATKGIERVSGELATREVVIRDTSGRLLPDALPNITFARYVRYATVNPHSAEADQRELRAAIERNTLEHPLAGFVLEGNTPYGRGDAPTTAILREAACSGMPVVCVGRGSVGGTTPPPSEPLFLGGANLTATKARFLLMACLLRFGAPPPAGDPQNPSPDERDAIKRYLAPLQVVFNSH